MMQKWRICEHFNRISYDSEEYPLLSCAERDEALLKGVIRSHTPFEQSKGCCYDSFVFPIQRVMQMRERGLLWTFLSN